MKELVFASRWPRGWQAPPRRSKNLTREFWTLCGPAKFGSGLSLFCVHKKPSNRRTTRAGDRDCQRTCSACRGRSPASRTFKPSGVVECLKAGACDVALIGNTPARAAEVDFSPPYLQADFTYLVPAGSSVGRIADADQTGVRIAVVRNHAMDFALRGKLKKAEPAYAESPDAAFDLLRTGHVTVLAGNFKASGLISRLWSVPARTK